MKNIITVISYLGYNRFETKEEFDKKYPTHNSCRLSSSPKKFPLYVQCDGIIGEFGDLHVYYKMKYLYDSDIEHMNELIKESNEN